MDKFSISKNKKMQQIADEVEKVIVGKREVVTMLLIALLSGGHVLVEDVPGVGKTTLATALGKATGLVSRRAQFTPDVMASDITGFTMFNKEANRFEYRQGLVMTNILLADEINRAAPKTQSALLEAMEERHVTVDGITHDLPKPFIVIATQNQVGSAGTQLLPSSQLDRFLIRTSMGYPDMQSQIEIMKDRHHENPLDRVVPLTDKETLNKLISEAQNTHVADPVYEYASRLVEETRHNQYIQIGISPRGALALCRAAKSHAFLDGRDYVVPEDVAAVFTDVCAHRLVLEAKARLHELSSEEILSVILKETAKPTVTEFSLK